MAEALSEPESQPLIQVRELTTSFYSRDGVARAVDGVSFELRRGETWGWWVERLRQVTRHFIPP